MCFVESLKTCYLLDGWKISYCLVGVVVNENKLKLYIMSYLLFFKGCFWFLSLLITKRVIILNKLPNNKAQ